MSAAEERLAAIEAHLAHQAKAIEELSEEVRRQGEALDRAEKALRAVAGRLVAVEENADPRPEITRPPHY